MLSAEKEIDEKRRFYFLNKTYQEDVRHKSNLKAYDKERRKDLKELIEDREKHTSEITSNLRNLKLAKNEDNYTIMEKQTKGMDRAEGRRHKQWEEKGMSHEKKHL